MMFFSSDITSSNCLDMLNVPVRIDFISTTFVFTSRTERRKSRIAIKNCQKGMHIVAVVVVFVVVVVVVVVVVIIGIAVVRVVVVVVVVYSGVVVTLL